MPRLEDLVAAERCAVITMEIQRGVVGDLSCIPLLQKTVEASGMIANTQALLSSARAAGVRVVHATAAFRRDRAGSFQNVPMVNALLRNPDHMIEGSPEVEVVPELGPEPEDLVSQRFHGMSPFTNTPLDAMLRSLGVQTVVATGVSLNVGILGLVIEAVNRGYSVVVPRDCVVGFPEDYGEAVLDNTLAQLGKLCTAGELSEIWSG